MCLAVPGKIIETYTENELLMGRIDFGGVVKTACLEYVPEIKIGQYAIVHAGFAITVVDEDEVKEYFDLWQQVIESEQKQKKDQK